MKYKAFLKIVVFMVNLNMKTNIQSILIMEIILSYPKLVYFLQHRLKFCSDLVVLDKISFLIHSHITLTCYNYKTQNLKYSPNYSIPRIKK